MREIDDKKNENIISVDLLIEDIVLFIDENKPDEILKLCDEISPSDLAAVLEQLTDDMTVYLVHLLDEKIQAETFSQLRLQKAELALNQLKDEHIGRIIAELDSDDAIELMEYLPQERRQNVLASVNLSIRALVEEGLSFPEDSAGRIMEREFIAVPRFWTIGKTLDYLRASKDNLPSPLYDIFIVDIMHKVVGEVPLSYLFKGKRTDKIETVSKDVTKIVPADTDQEEVAHLFKRYNISTVAVVDESERLIGSIGVDDIVDVLEEEAHEDIMHLSGLSETDIYHAVIGTSKSRMPWLILNLFTAFLVSSTIGQFDDVIDKIVALAVLMPIVASTAGNAATQTLAVTVRSLATKQLSNSNYGRVLLKELLVGALNGFVFAAMAGIGAGLIYSNFELGLTLGLAMVANFVVAAFIGMMVPLSLNWFGRDPALGASVFVTFTTDVAGYVFFLGLAGLLLFS